MSDIPGEPEEIAPDQSRPAEDWGLALAINAVLEQARVIANGTLPRPGEVTKLRFLLRAMDQAAEHQQQEVVQ